MSHPYAHLDEMAIGLRHSGPTPLPAAPPGPDAGPGLRDASRCPGADVGLDTPVAVEFVDTAGFAGPRIRPL